MADWKLDQGYNLDWGSEVAIESETEFSIDTTYIAIPFVHDGLEIHLEMEQEFSIDVIHAVSLDLLELVPEKFRNSEILQDYLSEAGLQVGGWLTSVRDIVKLLGPDTVADLRYLRYLGALIGVEFSPEDETTEVKTRKEITHAIDWYKMKGTYQSVQVLAMIQQLTINLYDMYTNDYSTFYMADWFVGNEDENPPGLDASYYKSPHFGLEILLNQVYEVGSLKYLWEAKYLDNIYLQVEKTRPVHTVPHYIMLLNPKTDELGHIIEVDGEIRARVLGSWEISTKYFDMEGSGEAWNFDDGTYFDQSAEAFIKSVTKWVLGTGNYPCNLGDSGWDVEDPTLSGVIDPNDIVITDQKITFEFIVPKASKQDGISSLGLYTPGSPDKLVLGSCFPKLDKDDRVELRVLVEVYKKDLS